MALVHVLLRNSSLLDGAPRIGDDELAAIMAAVTKAFADQRLNPDLIFEARIIRTGDEQVLRVSWDSYIR